MRILYSAAVLIFVFSLGYVSRDLLDKKTTQIVNQKEIKKPLDKYTIENLARADIKPGVLKITETLSVSDQFSSYLFEFTFNPNLDQNTLKTTTGMINIPSSETYEEVDYSSQKPMILMIRGFVDQTLYATGVGTRNAANYFASHGFITIAPDFLGYAGSSPEAEDVFETRFQTYITVISLLNTLQRVPVNPELFLGPQELISQLTSNNLPLFIWAHSNGGQIALTALEATRRTYPTVLWAPVTKPFPYSILYYTDEAEDGGKFLRKRLAEFEELYDTDKYSHTLHLDMITAPIKLNQGTSDESIPTAWSNDFVASMEELGKDVQYQIFPGANHNMTPVWNEVIESDLVFFIKFLEIDPLTMFRSRYISE